MDVRMSRHEGLSIICITWRGICDAWRVFPAVPQTPPLLHDGRVESSCVEPVRLALVREARVALSLMNKRLF